MDERELARNPFTGKLEPARQVADPLQELEGIQWLMDILSYPGEKTDLYDSFQEVAPPGFSRSKGATTQFDSGLTTRTRDSQGYGTNIVLDPGPHSVMSPMYNGASKGKMTYEQLMKLMMER